MKNRAQSAFRRIVSAGIAVSLLLGTVSFAHGGEDFEGMDHHPEPEMIEASAAVDFETVEEEVTEESANLKKQELFLRRLKDELNLSKADYRQVTKSLLDAEKRLEMVHEEMLNLTEQLENIDMTIARTTVNLIDVIQQIIQVENEIFLVNDQITEKEIILEYQKELLRDYLTTIYIEQDTYFSISEQGDVSAFKLLLSDGGVGEHLAELENLDLLNDAGTQIIDRLELLERDLVTQKLVMNQKKDSLEALRAEVEFDKDQLEMQKEAKLNLLKLTEGQERIYSQLLEQTQEERDEVLQAIQNYGSAVEFIDRKIAADGASFDPDDYLSLLDARTQAVYRFRFGINTESGDGFLWPVEPDRGISAYFRDAGYHGVFGVPHNAVDVPAYQRTPIRAAADGVAYIVKDNGYGYSYIILAHADGFMSVYGHMNEMLIEEGQTVPAGFVIGLSGGMPGTIGAGYMTTGPHLHFEILKNGVHVDPLMYLPLINLTEEQMAWLPKKYKDKWAEEVEELLGEEEEDVAPVIRKPEDVEVSGVLREDDFEKVFRE